MTIRLVVVSGLTPLLDQLVQAVHGNNHGTEAFGYDANGNRNTNGFTPTIDNRYSSDGTYSYEYDNEGNLKRRTRTGETIDFVWDHHQRLIEVSYKDGAYGTGNYVKRVLYRYDAFDRRIEKLVHNYSGGVVTSAFAERYFYDGHDLLYVTDGNYPDTTFGRLLSRYLPGPLVDQVFADETNSTTGELLWVLADHQGTARDFADNTGTIKDHLFYNAFGVPVTEIAGNASWSLKTASSPRRLREGFTGLTWDVDVYQDFSDSRVYKPGLGRWMSQDWIPFVDGPNPYEYAYNSPVNFVDPSGFDGVDPPSRASVLAGIGNREEHVRTTHVPYDGPSMRADDRPWYRRWMDNARNWTTTDPRGSQVVTIGDREYITVNWTQNDGMLAWVVGNLSNLGVTGHIKTSHCGAIQNQPGKCVRMMVRDH